MKGLISIIILTTGAVSIAVAGSSSDNFTKKNAVTFTENKGQIGDQFSQPRPDVLFYGEVNGLSYYLRKDGISYQQYRKLEKGSSHSKTLDESRNVDQVPDQLSVYRTDIQWIGLNTKSLIEFGESLPGDENYYLETCPDGITGVKSFESVTYKDVYPGIDLKWYGNQGNLEYDFMVSPGGNYRTIKWIIQGAQALEVNEKGELVVTTPFGQLIEQPPYVTQGSQIIDSKWLIENDVIGFDIGRYDNNKPLRIDPIVRHWGTYYGGNPNETGGAETDGMGNVYLFGRTASPIYVATSGSHQSTIGGMADAYVVKFDSTGIRQWATYFGGSSNEFNIAGAVDGSQNIYISGKTDSPTAIATAGSHQSVIAGNADAFLVKFDAGGTRVWGTYYGSGSYDAAISCHVDAANNVYICGETASSGSGISTPGSHQPAFSGGLVSDAFMAKFNSAGVCQWGTFYGGYGYTDFANACTTDDSLNVYVVGYTRANYTDQSIATSTSYQPSYGGGDFDMFIVKFNASGVRQWGTYYGGIGKDQAMDVTADTSGVYVVGFSGTSSGMSTIGSHQPTYSGFIDGMLIKLSHGGVPIWSTYYGGYGEDVINSCTLDDHGNIYLGGSTKSNTHISTPVAVQPNLSGNNFYDAFIAKFNTNGIRDWASYLGGTLNDEGQAVAVDPWSVYLAGATESSTNMATQNGYQFYKKGDYDAFLIRLHECSADTVVVSVNACESYESPSGKYVWTSSGNYTDSLLNSGGCDSILEIDLTIDSLKAEISWNGSVITSDSADTYQWLDCDKDTTVINGANGQSFTPTKNGSFAVAVSKNSCADTSECITVTGVGIETSISDKFLVYPNPTNSTCYVEFDSKQVEVAIMITDSRGREILFERFKDTDKVHFQLDQSPGIYFLKVTTPTKTKAIRLVVQ